MQRGEQTKQDAAQHRHRQRHRKHAPIDAHLGDPRQRDERRMREGPNRQHGQADAGNGAEERERDTLGEKLTQHAPVGRAEGGAESDLPLSRRSATREQRRDIGRRDQKNQ